MFAKALNPKKRVLNTSPAKKPTIRLSSQDIDNLKNPLLNHYSLKRPVSSQRTSSIKEQLADRLGSKTFSRTHQRHGSDISSIKASRISQRPSTKNDWGEIFSTPQMKAKLRLSSVNRSNSRPTGQSLMGRRSLLRESSERQTIKSSKYSQKSSTARKDRKLKSVELARGYKNHPLVMEKINNQEPPKNIFSSSYSNILEKASTKTAKKSLIKKQATVPSQNIFKKTRPNSYCSRPASLMTMSQASRSRFQQMEPMSPHVTSYHLASSRGLVLSKKQTKAKTKPQTTTEGDLDLLARLDFMTRDSEFSKKSPGALNTKRTLPSCITDKSKSPKDFKDLQDFQDIRDQENENGNNSGFFIKMKPHEIQYDAVGNNFWNPEPLIDLQKEHQSQQSHYSDYTTSNRLETLTHFNNPNFSNNQNNPNNNFNNNNNNSCLKNPLLDCSKYSRLSSLQTQYPRLQRLIAFNLKNDGQPGDTLLKKIRQRVGKEDRRMCGEVKKVMSRVREAQS